MLALVMAGPPLLALALAVVGTPTCRWTGSYGVVVVVVVGNYSVYLMRSSEFDENELFEGEDEFATFEGVIQ